MGSKILKLIDVISLFLIAISFSYYFFYYLPNKNKEEQTNIQNKIIYDECKNQEMNHNKQTRDLVQSIKSEEEVNNLLNDPNSKFIIGPFDFSACIQREKINLSNIKY